MGYTNYWYQYRDFTDSEWDEIKDFAYMLSDVHSGVCFFVREKTIVINGVSKEYMCEDFVLHKHEPKPRYEGDKTYFNFCKTRELPYDKVVWKLLKFIKLIVLDPTKADFIISNDNGDEIVSISDTITLDKNSKWYSEQFDRTYEWINNNNGTLDNLIINKD